ncbi:MAG: TetR/AcrR family transcriptional regulator [Pseudomonadota bacterium]
MQQPGRPREFDPEEMLSKIMHLFWENGYEATGLSDIIAATGMGKASLYSAFGNKRAMYLKALAQYEILMVDAAVAILRAHDRAPLDRIDAYLSAPLVAVRDEADRRGCFLCNAAADRASLDGKTGALVLRGYGKMRSAVAAALQDADPDLDAASIARNAQLIVTVYSGMRVMSRSGMEVADLALAKDAVLANLTPPQARA